MSNRYIKDSVLMSDSLEALTDFQEAFFYRLIVTVDDFGRFDARPNVLRCRMYPLREFDSPVESEAFLTQIGDALEALEREGIIRLYTVNGRPYLVMTSWAKHQRVRSAVSKFPDENGIIGNPNGNFSKPRKSPDDDLDAETEDVQKNDTHKNVLSKNTPRSKNKSRRVIDTNTPPDLQNTPRDAQITPRDVKEHAADIDFDIDFDIDYDKRQTTSSSSSTYSADDDENMQPVVNGEQSRQDAFADTWLRTTGKEATGGDMGIYDLLRMDYEHDDIIGAVQEAFEHSARGNWAYIKKTLRNWKENGKRDKPTQGNNGSNGPKVEVINGKKYIDGYEMVS